MNPEYKLDLMMLLEKIMRQTETENPRAIVYMLFVAIELIAKNETMPSIEIQKMALEVNRAVRGLNQL